MEQAEFYSLTGEELVVLAAALAIIMSKGLTPDQLSILGNFLESLAQNILIIQAAISAQSTTSVSTPASQEPEATQTLTDLQKELKLLKSKMAQLEARL